MFKNKELFTKLLKEIKENSNKVLTNNHFTDDQWIEYNEDNHSFQYEDKILLGTDEQEVVKLYEELFEQGFADWLSTADWYIKDRPSQN